MRHRRVRRFFGVWETRRSGGRGRKTCHYAVAQLHVEPRAFILVPWGRALSFKTAAR